MGSTSNKERSNVVEVTRIEKHSACLLRLAWRSGSRNSDLSAPSCGLRFLKGTE
jgi:hypothetical protein